MGHKVIYKDKQVLTTYNKNLTALLVRKWSREKITDLCTQRKWLILLE